jgi:streptogramin lyase
VALAQDLYVTDTTTNDLSVIDIASNSVVTIPGTTHLDDPSGIALDTYAGNTTYDGDLFIANGNGSIVAFNPTNETFSNNIASGVGLSDPQGLAFDSSGNLYVANASGGGSIDKYSLSTSTWSTYASNLGSTPEGIAIDGNGDLFVTVSSAKTIVEITPNGSIGSVHSFYPGSNSSNPALDGPVGIAFNPKDGDLYVANSQAGATSPSVDRITLFPQGSTSLNADLSDPQGVTFTANGNLYVADYGNNTVTEYSQIGTTGIFTLTGNSPITGYGLITPDFMALDSTGLPVPEPGTYAMFLAGLALLVLRQRWATTKS